MQPLFDLVVINPDGGPQTNPSSGIHVTTYLVSNRKGGSGKTAIAVNLAALYAQAMPVLLVDLDTQGDASAWLGIHETGESLADALTGRTGLADAIRETEAGVDVAPAGEAIDLVAERVRSDSVRRAIDSVADRYGAVVIDCPPALSPLVIAAFRAGPTVRALVPVDGPRALAGVARLRYAWEDAGLGLADLRVVLTRHDRRRVLDRAIADQAADRYGDAVLGSRIRESVIVSESASWCRPLVLHAPTHPVTGDFRALAREVSCG